jgi:hypothetical protein
MHIVFRLKLQIMVQVIMGRFIGGPFFHPFVFPNKWSRKDVRGMFHRLAATVTSTPSSHASNAYYKFASIQLHVLFLQLPDSDVWSTWGISILVIILQIPMTPSLLKVKTLNSWNTLLSMNPMIINIGYKRLYYSSHLSFKLWQHLFYWTN